MGQVHARAKNSCLRVSNAIEMFEIFLVLLLFLVLGFSGGIEGEDKKDYAAPRPTLTADQTAAVPDGQPRIQLHSEDAPTHPNRCPFEI